MPTHPRLTVVAHDEAIETKVRAQNLLEAFTRATSDGTLDRAETRTLRAAIVKLLDAASSTVRATRRADLWQRIGVACFQGGVNRYLRKQAAEDGLDVDPRLTRKTKNSA